MKSIKSRLADLERRKPPGIRLADKPKRLIELQQELSLSPLPNADPFTVGVVLGELQFDAGLDSCDGFATPTATADLTDFERGIMAGHIRRKLHLPLPKGSDQAEALRHCQAIQDDPTPERIDDFRDWVASERNRIEDGTITV